MLRMVTGYLSDISYSYISYFKNIDCMISIPSVMLQEIQKP